MFDTTLTFLVPSALFPTVIVVVVVALTRVGQGTIAERHQNNPGVILLVV